MCTIQCESARASFAPSDDFSSIARVYPLLFDFFIITLLPTLSSTSLFPSHLQVRPVSSRDGHLLLDLLYHGFFRPAEHVYLHNNGSSRRGSLLCRSSCSHQLTNFPPPNIRSKTASATCALSLHLRQASRLRRRTRKPWNRKSRALFEAS